MVNGPKEYVASVMLKKADAHIKAKMVSKK